MGRKLWEMGIEGLDGVSGGKGKPTPIGPSGSRSFVMEGVTYADTPKNHPKILSDVAWVKVAESCLQGRPSAAAWWDVHGNEDTMVVAPHGTLNRWAPLFYEYESIKSWTEETFAGILSNQPKTTTHFNNPTIQITTEKLNGHNQQNFSLEVERKWDVLHGGLDIVSQTYSKKGDTAQIHELKTMIYDTKQKDLSVIAYYNTLKVLRQELDLYQHIEMEYALDATRLAKMIEQDQIFNLLAGLNPQLDREEVKYLENILFHPYMKFIPMCSEESRRVVMTGPTPQENSALNTIQDSNLGLPKGGENESRWSDHCNKPRHTRETCWKLHGKPPSRAKDSHKCNKQFRTSKGF
ncbi:hypothetical protein CK203_082650 [Vitis vinifera]|uniref:Retrotransposon gag domain-containing protein n=1 Tax=Vitis vinifera TaxID=29760 RepID=A0A438BWQ6_VITVI|nr:hypothetical protein CK203_082650 [Vitis vinifera]